MTMHEFIAECGARLVDPALALENANIVAALRTGDYDLICRVMDEEF